MNSAGKPEESIQYFKDALKLAEDTGLEFYAVDAAHMLGIAAKGEESLRWNEEAIRMSYRDYEALEHPHKGHFAHPV